MCVMSLTLKKKIKIKLQKIHWTARSKFQQGWDLWSCWRDASSWSRHRTWVKDSTEGAEELCLGPLQKGRMPAPRQDSGRKHAEHEVFYTPSPTYISLVLSFLLHSVRIYAWRDRAALQTPIPLLQHTGTSSPRLAGVAEIPPGRVPSISPRDRPLVAVGQQQEEAPAGSAKTRVSRFCRAHARGEVGNVH